MLCVVMLNVVAPSKWPGWDFVSLDSVSRDLVIASNLLSKD
jgi:hypothetical protein